jgi:hypothetical protein
MSADMEARLRASLRAYADLVEDPADDVALPVRPSRSVIHRWRTPLLAAAAVAAVAGGVWTAVAVVDPGASSTLAGGESAVSASGGEERAETLGTPAEQSAGDASAADSAAEAAAAPLAVGETVPFELYTHCGVLGAYVDGVWFAAQSPLVEGGPLVPGGANPPAGWGNPYQAGTLTLETADTAVFRDDAGHEVRLSRAPDQEPPPCD